MLNFKSSFYENLFKSLDTNAVLMRVEDDGRYFPIWCSKEFTEMMEGTEEEFIELESGGTMQSIHRDDRSEVGYLFRHHITKDGTNSLNIRKRGFGLIFIIRLCKKTAFGTLSATILILPMLRRMKNALKTFMNLFAQNWKIFPVTA